MQNQINALENSVRWRCRRLTQHDHVGIDKIKRMTKIETTLTGTIKRNNFPGTAIWDEWTTEGYQLQFSNGPQNDQGKIQGLGKRN